jgi:phosphoglycerol transferase MdoB-like AlkP superfamily enzyme
MTSFSASPFHFPSMPKTIFSPLRPTTQRYTSFTKTIVITSLVIWSLLRVFLWAGLNNPQIDAMQAMQIVGYGFWFDLNALAYSVVPFLIISLVISKHWKTRAWYSYMQSTVLFFIVYSLIFGAVSEIIFWQEFTTRFNFIAVDYLIYTHEVISNIRESYPVPAILILIACTALVIVLGVKKYAIFNPAPYTKSQKISRLFLAIALPLFSWQFANVDQMGFSKNAYATELSGNGIFSFAAAAHRNTLDYDQFYRTIPQTKADTLLAKLGLERQQRDTITAESSTLGLGPFKRRPKNIILISVESLSASYLGTYGNKENLTPYLDKLATESLVFDKLFATGTRTVRGLDALSIGIPPIPGQAIIHRPNNAHLATVGEFLEAQNFSTYFIYGGYGVFDNMNQYFKGNDYAVMDRTDFDKNTIQSENVWGVDDESLFKNALTRFDQNIARHKPFFAHIMTTSNHRPFTFPEGKIDLPQGHRAGAVKYTDYAIGKFIETAKTKPWFKDTLFVIVADHCASVAGKTKLPVDKYHIPLFFYAPDLLSAGHDTKLASQIDIPPTLLHLVGAKGAQHFFGQSLFNEEENKLAPRAFISNYQELGYYKNDTLIVLSPKQKAEAYHVNAHTLESSPIKMNNVLLEEAIAYYQTANRAFKTGELKESANLN